MSELTYEYGSIKLNNGTRYKARRATDGAVSYVSHHGEKKASKKVAESFQKGTEALVQPSNRYQFDDERGNPHIGHNPSSSLGWREH